MRNALRMIALGSALSLAATSKPSGLGMTMVGAQDQDHQGHYENPREQSRQDYLNNRYYKVGKKEGYHDYQRKTQRKVHDHHYRSDDDRRAHDYGYQQGWQGQRYSDDHYHNDQR